MDPNLAHALNGGDDDEEALRRAIAMSLGEGVDPPTDGRVSPTQSQASTASQIDLTSSPPVKSSQPTAAAPATSSMHGLDRKKMEEERLARLKKRKAPDIEDLDVQPPQQRVKRTGATMGIVPPHLKDEVVGKLATRRTMVEGTPNGSGHQSQNGEVKLPYPNGVVKKTWARGRPRTNDHITIEEVFQKEILELAVLSSFQWDGEWAMSKLNLSRTSVLFVAYASNDAHKEEIRSNVRSNAIRFCFPPMAAMGIMHSKLQLLKYPNYLRIVVPTANLVAFDWGETGYMENMVFLVDLPRIVDSDKMEGNQLTAFGESLSCFLNAQGIEETMIKSLSKYDFSATERLGFVHTIAGSHLAEDAWQRTGYCGLGRAVSSLGWSSDIVEVDILTASIGALDNDMLTAMYYACQGDSGKKIFDARASRPRGKKGESASARGEPSFAGHLRVYFPSNGTVSRSRGGKNAAGVICLHQKHWDSPSFPRQVLRDFDNVSEGLLSHSKVIFVRRPVTDSTGGGSAPGWAYIGSANLTESAWGRLVKDRSTGKPKLTCRNWECGVVLPAPRAAGESSATPVPSSAEEVEGTKMLDLFRTTVPIPMALPGSRYHDGSENQGPTQPWLFNAN